MKAVSVRVPAQGMHLLFSALARVQQGSQRQSIFMAVIADLMATDC